MGRKSREKKQRRRQTEELRDFAESLAGDLGPLGISNDQALELVRDGMRKIAQRMAEGGAATRAPWGRVVYDLRALERSLETSLLMMRRGNEEIGARGDADDLTDRDAFLMLAQSIGGAVTAAASAVLWLSSQPIPYELARHVTTRENPAE